MKGLTDRQARVFEYVVTYRQERGISPTFREIAGHFGVSLQAAQNIISLIRKKGFLTWAEGRARTLKAADYSESSTMTVFDRVAKRPAPHIINPAVTKPKNPLRLPESDEKAKVRASAKNPAIMVSMPKTAIPAC